MKIKHIIAIILAALAILVILSVFFFFLFSQSHRGLPLSEKEVSKLKRLAESGDIGACRCLSAYYVEDDKKALYWIRKGAEYGDPAAQYNLYSELKNKSAKDKKEAVELLEKAAAQNYCSAQWELGQLHRDGDMVGRNLKQAEYWFRRAINNGCDLAMIDLSKLLVETRHDETGFVEAYQLLGFLLYQSNTGSTFAKNLRQQQEVIIEKAKKQGVDVATIKRKAELQIEELKKNIPHKKEETPDEFYRDCLKKIE
ncbi:MAG: sel1 repeat family protein [Deltaproteobacteria bacterium]|nr:sel1 repeat family protein [Deltaproteobacteria bacterium]